MPEHAWAGFRVASGGHRQACFGARHLVAVAAIETALRHDLDARRVNHDILRTKACNNGWPLTFWDILPLVRMLWPVRPHQRLSLEMDRPEQLRVSHGPVTATEDRQCCRQSNEHSSSVFRRAHHASGA